MVHTYTPQTTRNVKSEVTAPDSLNAAALDCAKALEEEHQHLQDFWDKTQKATKRFYDKKYTDQEFVAG